MSPPLLALALLGTAGWLLSRWRAWRAEPATWFRLVTEALAVHTAVTTLFAVALVSLGAFRPAYALALAAATPFALQAAAGRRPRPATPGWASRTELTSLVVLALVAPAALPRLEPLRMDSDAGVYANRAIHHLHQGGLTGSIPVRDRLDGELLAVFDRDNLLAAGSAGSPIAYLPGTYTSGADTGRFHFQFFPGWPMAMALWAGVFGLPRLFHALAFVYTLDVLLFGLLVQRHVQGTTGRTLSLALFASSPLLLFFGKYSTSEIFLLFLFLFVLHFLGEGTTGAVLAALGVLLLVVSHASTFLYAPLLLLPMLAAWRLAERRLALFLLLSFAALLVGLPLGHFFSPDYLAGTLSACFRFLPVGDAAFAGFVVLATFYAAGMAASALLLRRSNAAPPQTAVASPADRLVSVAVPVAVGLIALAAVWRGWQLGWTDRFLQAPAHSAWAMRTEYAGQGWASIAHLDLVSMLLATSLVGLPAAAAVALLRPRETCGTPARAFLLAATLWTVAVYTVFGVDVPFNYYASRHFLPVLLPSTVLLLGSLVGHFRPRWALLAPLALVGLAFNVRFDLPLSRVLPGNKLQVVQELAHRVGHGGVLFVRVQPPTHRLLALSLDSLDDIDVVRVAHLGELPESALVERYAVQLGLGRAVVLSPFEPGGAQPATALEVEDGDLVQRGVLYPTEVHGQRKLYYLYEVAFAGSPRAAAAR